MILGIRTDGDQDLWIDLHQNRVEMVDFGEKTERETIGFYREEEPDCRN